MSKIWFSSRPGCTRLIGALLAGAVSSVLVGWAYAFLSVEYWPEIPALAWGWHAAGPGSGPRIWRHYRANSGVVLAESREYAEASETNPFPGPRVSAVDFQIPDLDEIRMPPSDPPFEEHVPWPDAGERTISDTDAMFGWPLPCVWAPRWTGYLCFPGEPRATSATLAIPFTKPNGKWIGDGPNTWIFDSRAWIFDKHQRACLPIGILWKGLTIDTACYGLAWWSLLVVPAAIRNACRRHRGLCVRCAYDLAGLPPRVPCPECGNRQEIPLVTHLHRSHSQQRP